MRAAVVYSRVSGRSLGGKSLDWMRELVDDYGEDAVCDALDAMPPDVDPSKVLGHLAKALARGAQSAAHHRAPVEHLGPRATLALARGERPYPRGPYTYETHQPMGEHLTDDELREVERWRMSQRGVLA